MGERVALSVPLSVILVPVNRDVVGLVRSGIRLARFDGLQASRSPPGWLSIPEQEVVLQSFAPRAWCWHKGCNSPHTESNDVISKIP